MAIAIGPEVGDGIYLPYSYKIIYDTPTLVSTGSTSSTYKAATVSRVKLASGSFSASPPPKPKVGAMISNHDPEITAALFGSGEF